MPSSNSHHQEFSNNAVGTATEGWLELFLTRREKFTFSKWKGEEDLPRRNDAKKKSLKEHEEEEEILVRFFTCLSAWIPDHISPNVLSLAGLVVLQSGWYITPHHGGGQQLPTILRTCYATSALLCYYLLTRVEPFHTQRIRQRTALSDLFRSCCHSCSTIFLVLLTLHCLMGGGDGGSSSTSPSPSLQWLAVQTAQLVLYMKHLKAFDSKKDDDDGLKKKKSVFSPRRRRFGFGGESIMTSMIPPIVVLVVLREVFGLERLVPIYERFVSPLLEACVKDRYQDLGTLVHDLFLTRCLLTYFLALGRTFRLRSQHGWSCFGLSFSLLIRLLLGPALWMITNKKQAADMSVVDVIRDGLLLAVLTSDLVLATMAKREIHPLVVLMMVVGITTPPATVVMTLVLFYYVAVFVDLSFYTNLPVFATCRNVYCDGVYDLCHIGHKKLFQNALKLGNRLYVGVVGDEDANAYKRPPIMNHAERCAEVEACKAVTKVIPNAPCFGLTKEFLDEHQIHVVAFGQEYLERWPNPKDDLYYAYPRQQGMAFPLPRTMELSTSDLIRRIQEARPADEKKSPT